MPPPFCHIRGCEKDARVSGIASWMAGYLPDGDFRRIAIKPNLVKHAEHPAFPVSALVTATFMIEAAVEACLQKYSSAESITVCDAPLQTCDWDLLVRQAGIDRLADRFAPWKKPRVSFVDLRRAHFEKRNGYIEGGNGIASGDPAGYAGVVLDDRSFLEAVSGQRGRFRVDDYDPALTAGSHRAGCHRYLVAGTVLDSDLFVNLPKLKTHQKAGLTCALKNLVGIIGDKACLVHHMRGKDEFAPGTPWPVRLQVRARALLQGRSRAAFSSARRVWNLLKRAHGIETEGTRDNLDGAVYVGAGSWYGNDTIWRMIYDLNKVVSYAPPGGGPLRDTPQRARVAFMDAVVAGEGNGPIQPLAVETGVVAAANDPFLLDMAASRLMGFDWRLIPKLARFREFNDPILARFDPESVSLEFNGETLRGIKALPVLHGFLPPPGWKGHIEERQGK